VVVNDTSQSEIYIANPLLPETRSEMGIPLKLGKKIIGALDIQANRINAFSQDDIAVLQILADQIAVAIDNAKAFELSQKAIAEMTEVDRLKSQFLANMSHELRTPLNSIIGFSRVILKGIDGPINDVQTQDLLAIYNSGQHLLSLINDILDLSKVEAGKMMLELEPMQAAMLVQAGLQVVREKAMANRLRLTAEIANDLGEVWLDERKVKQILYNLLSNAVKFTRPRQPAIIEVGSVRQGDKDVIFVRDNGVGFDTKHVSKLFGVFQRLHRQEDFEGTGIGLAIVQRIIHKHRGRVWAEAELNKGAAFYFMLGVPEEHGPKI
jgi:signal transduction histidine kinase